MGGVGGIIDYYSKMAYRGGLDAQLEAAKAFGKYCDEKSKQRKVISEGGLEAILFLTDSDSLHVVLEAMKVMTILCSVHDFARDLVIERDCFTYLAKLVVHHDIEVQIMSARCIGYLGSHRSCTKRLVSQGALLPILGLLRQDLDSNLLLEICVSISKCYLNYDFALRIVIIWGVLPVKELVYVYKSQIEKISTSYASLNSRIVLEKLELYQRILVALVDVLRNYSTCDKIAYYMIYEDTICILTDIASVLLHHSMVDVRRIATMICYHLVQHKACRELIVKHDIVRQWIETIDTDYDSRHNTAKALNTLCELCHEDEMEIVRSRVKQYSSITFVYAMIRSIGCMYIQRMVLDILIQGDLIIRENNTLFSHDFIKSVINLSSTSIDLQIKRICSELIYKFSRIQEFHELLVREGSEILIPHLVFKDIESKSWSVKTLAQLGETVDMLPVLRQNGIIVPTIRCFLMTSNRRGSEQEILSNIMRIIAMLSDFGDLRKEILQLESGRALTKLLDIFDRCLQEQEWNTLGLCLKIFTAFIKNANHEGSGNANLKILSEKRLFRMADLVLCDNFKVSIMITEVFVAYSQHNNVPIPYFWPNLFEKLVEMSTCGHNYSILSYQREELMKALLVMIKKNTSMVNSLISEYHSQLNTHQKQFKFYYGFDPSEDNNCFENVLSNIHKYLEHFEVERKKKNRRYIILNKLKRSIVALSKYQKENEENAEKLSNLLAEAQNNEAEAASNLEYEPLKHQHHYDDELSGILFRNFYQPKSTETKLRLEELLLRTYSPVTNILDSRNSNVHSVHNKPNNNPDELIHKTTSSNSIRSVSYNPQQHMRKKMQKDTPTSSRAKPFLADEKFVSDYDTVKDSSVDRNTATLSGYTKISFKPKEERKREEVNDRIKRRYLQRSTTLNLLALSPGISIRTSTRRSLSTSSTQGNQQNHYQKMIADHHQQNNNSTDSDDTLANLSVKDLTQMKREIEKNLRQIEQQIFNLEGNYLEETGNFGNVVKGFEGYLSTRARASQSTRKTKFKDSDRIFSNSSYVLIPAISSHPSDKSSTAGMLLNGSSGESSVARGMDDHAATAKIRKNAATMTPSAHTNEKSLTGNITFVDEHSNPLRKEVALSEENKDLVFQTNARKRKLPASDQNIQKRRRRKVSRHLLLSQQEGEGEELDDKTNKKKEVVASTSRTENASIPSENRRAEETPVAATTTDAVLLEKKQKREKSKPTKDNEHDSTPTTGDPPQKAQALSAQSATSQQESRKTNSDRLTKPSTPEKTNLDNDELLAGQEEDSLDVVSPGGDGDNEDKDHVVDEDEEDDEADEEEVDGDDDETMTTVTSGHDDDFVSSITAASGNVDSVTEGSVLEDHSSEEE